VTPPPARVPEWSIALATGAALLLVLTWPTLPGLMSYGRLDTGDGRYSIWNVAWIGHALLTDPRHLLDANIFHPHTGTLAYSELNLVAGVLGLPVYAVTGNAIAATNAAVILGLLMAFMITWVLVRRLTGSNAGGLAAGTTLTFCPYVQSHTAHIQLLMVFGLPLALLAFHAFRGQPDAKRAAVLGAALAVAGLGCAYYGIFSGLALAVVGLCLAIRERRYWVGLAIAAGVAALIVLPVFLPYMAARRAVAASPGWSAEQVRGYSATLAEYRSSPSYLHEHLVPLLRPSLESLFPGFLPLALATIGVAAVVRRATTEDRRIVAAYLALIVCGAWASLGPDAGLYTLLMKVVPAFGLLRAPARMGLIVTFGVAVLAGFGVRRIAAGRSWVGFVLLPLLAAELASVPWPLVEADSTVPRAYRVLASKPRGALVEFPFNYKPADFHNHTGYMFNSTFHWQPLVNGYSDVIPPDFAEMAVPINAFPDPQSFALMKRLNVTYIIWHMEQPRGYDPVSRQVILDRLPPYAQYLRQITTEDDVWLYEITGYPEH